MNNLEIKVHVYIFPSSPAFLGCFRGGQVGKSYQLGLIGGFLLFFWGGGGGGGGGGMGNYKYIRGISPL